MDIQPAHAYRTQVLALLQANKLPVDDLAPQLPGLVVALQQGEVVGVAGIERYGQAVLLRSVAVAAASRGQGIAALLVSHLEQMALQQGANAMYLLTETAAPYFANKGYAEVPRQQVAPAIQASAEFSHVCPQSAVVMVKHLG